MKLSFMFREEVPILLYMRGRSLAILMLHEADAYSSLCEQRRASLHCLGSGPCTLYIYIYVKQCKPSFCFVLQLALEGADSLP